MKRFLMIGALAGLFGCKRPEPSVRVVRVEVPVPVPCPPPPSLQRPRLPIQDITPDMAPADQEKAKVASIVLLMGYAHQLEELLAAYLPSKMPAKPTEGSK